MGGKVEPPETNSNAPMLGVALHDVPSISVVQSSVNQESEMAVPASYRAELVLKTW